jgi:hypothetical protein
LHPLDYRPKILKCVSRYPEKKYFCNLSNDLEDALLLVIDFITFSAVFDLIDFNISFEILYKKSFIILPWPSCSVIFINSLYEFFKPIKFRIVLFPFLLSPHIPNIHIG